MDINFLPNRNKQKKPRKDKEDSKEKAVAWSDPDKSRNNSGRTPKKKNFFSIKNFFSSFSLPKKDGQALPPSPNLSSELDKKKLKKSRQEILKLIKEDAKKKTHKGSAGKPKTGSSSWWTKILGRQPKEKKEVTIDYQKSLAKSEVKPKKSIKRERLIRKEEVRMKEAPKKEDKLPTGSDQAGLSDQPVSAERPDQISPPAPVATGEDKSGAEIKPEPAGAQKEKPNKKEDEFVYEKPKMRRVHFKFFPWLDYFAVEKKGDIARNEKKDEKAWQSPKILKTNLIKDQVVVFFDWQKNIISLLIFIILSCAVVISAYWGLTVWGDKKEKEIEVIIVRYNELNEKLNQTKQEAVEVFTFIKRLTLANTLLEQHKYWTNLFNFLERNTLNSVYYVNFFGDLSGKYNMPAIAKSFQAIEEQIRHLLTNNYVIFAGVDRGTIVSTESQSSGVNFSLKLIFDPAMFTD